MSGEDQRPEDYAAGILASEPGETPGCIHRHRDRNGKTYTHSHQGFAQPHSHLRDREVVQP
jgi:hypothetical protein